MCCSACVSISKPTMVLPVYHPNEKPNETADSVWTYHTYTGVGYEGFLEPYGTPSDIKDFCMQKYKDLFDDAERAVADNPVFLNRVRESRLPIQYAELEIARTEPIENIADLKDKLDLFKRRANELGVKYLNERNNTVEEYCELYSQRNLLHKNTNLAQDAEVNYIIPANTPYDKIAPKALTDGLYGAASYNESWVGWMGKDAEFVIDLKKPQNFSSVEADFLHNLGAWILLPKSMMLRL